MKRCWHVFVALLLCAACVPDSGLVRIDSGALALVPPLDATRLQARPRLFLNPRGVGELQRRRASGAYRSWLELLERRAAKWAAERPPAGLTGRSESSVRVYGNRLPFIALAYLRSGDPQLLAGARTWLDAFVRYPDWVSNRDLGAGHMLFGMSIAYDWLHADLTPAERVRYREKIELQAERLHAALTNEPASWSRLWLQSHNHFNVMALMAAAIALHGEVPQAAAWRRSAEANFAQVARVLSPDGAFHEGVAYWSYTVEALIAYHLMSLSVGGSGLTGSAFLEHTARFRLHMSLPGFDLNADFGDSQRRDADGPMHQLRALAALFEDGHAQWLANTITDARQWSQRVSWMDVLFYDPGVEPRAPYELPTTAWFDNHGLLVWRSGWHDDALWMLFKAGRPQGELAHAQGLHIGAHLHPDQGSIVVARGERFLLIDDGYVELKRAANHNVLVFGNRGQIGEGKRWFDAGASKRLQPQALRAAAALDPPYLAVDLAGLYPANARVQRWQRAVRVVEPDTIVVHDSVTMRAPGRIEALFHLERPPRPLSPGRYCLDPEAGITLELFPSEGLSLRVRRVELERVRHAATPARTVLSAVGNAGAAELVTIIRRDGRCERRGIAFDDGRLAIETPAGTHRLRVGAGQISDD